MSWWAKFRKLCKNKWGVRNALGGARVDTKVPPLVAKQALAANSLAGTIKPTSWGAVAKAEKTALDSTRDVVQTAQARKSSGEAQDPNQVGAVRFVGHEAQAKLDVLLGANHALLLFMGHEVTSARRAAKRKRNRLGPLAFGLSFLFFKAAVGWDLNLYIVVVDAVFVGLLLFILRADDDIARVQSDVRRTFDAVIETPWRLQRYAAVNSPGQTKHRLMLRVGEGHLNLIAPAATPGCPGHFELIGPCRVDVLLNGKKAFLCRIALGESATLRGSYSNVEAQTEPKSLAKHFDAQARHRTNLSAIQTETKRVLWGWVVVAFLSVVSLWLIGRLLPPDTPYLHDPGW